VKAAKAAEQRWDADDIDARARLARLRTALSRWEEPQGAAPGGGRSPIAGTA